MRQQEIVAHLSRITDPSVVIYTLTMHDVLSAIVRSNGTEALTLTKSDLNQAKEEVVALEHHLDTPPVQRGISTPYGNERTEE